MLFANDDMKYRMDELLGNVSVEGESSFISNYVRDTIIIIDQWNAIEPSSQNETTDKVTARSIINYFDSSNTCVYGSSANNEQGKFISKLRVDIVLNLFGGLNEVVLYIYKYFFFYP